MTTDHTTLAAGQAVAAPLARRVAAGAVRLKPRGGASAFAVPAAVGALLLLSMDPALAQGTGGTTAITTFLQNLVNIITGQAGQIIAVLAVALCGLGAMFGAMSARAFGGVVLGIAIVFSAAWVVQQITGGTVSL